MNAEVVLRTAAIDRDGSGFVDLEEFIDWWFRDKLTMKAKMEAKQKPPLSERDVSDIKERLSLPSVPDEKILEMKRAFTKYDSDGSGHLDSADLARMLEGSREIMIEAAGKLINEEVRAARPGLEGGGGMSS